ncbi:4434_t:CDS:2, partial [Funneliformis caledonium]
ISEELSKLHEEIFWLKNRISDLIMALSSNIPDPREVLSIPLTKDSSLSSLSLSSLDHNQPLLNNITSSSSEKPQSLSGGFSSERVSIGTLQEEFD